MLPGKQYGRFGLEDRFKGKSPRQGPQIAPGDSHMEKLGAFPRLGRANLGRANLGRHHLNLGGPASPCGRCPHPPRADGPWIPLVFLKIGVKGLTPCGLGQRPILLS